MGHEQALSAVLDDGRRLGYAEYGDPTGRPILYFHGMPGSRVEAQAFGEAAAVGGLRIVAVERPGMGASPMAPRRHVIDWTGDAAAFADTLGLGRFAVLGVSGGGPYALACAHALPERVSGCALVGAVAPLPAGISGGMDDAVRRHYRGLLMLRRLPVLARLVAAQTARKVRRPGGARALVAANMSATDQARIDASPRLAAAIEASITEAFRTGSAGFATDLRVLFTRPWGFPLGQIRVPVAIWHGEADANVPIADGHRLAAAIPDSQARFVGDAGHLLFVDQAADVLASLAVPS